jgi:hypothetical protein
VFDVGQGQAGHPEQPADHHQRNKARRDGPEGAAAERHGEQADRHHGEHVVEAADRVDEAVRQPAGVAHACVRCGEGGQKGGAGAGDSYEPGTTCHGV